MAAVEGVRIGGDDGPLRKRPRISELPLSSAKRSTIDGLLHGFKKKGEFDKLRKQIYTQFESGDSKVNLLTSLNSFTDGEIERDPLKYLSKDRRFAAPLLEGAAARADIYPRTEADITSFINEYLQQAEVALRDARRKDIGDDAEAEERRKGARSDDVYADEAQVRRLERAKRYQEVLRLKKKKEREEAKKRELEALKKREAELIREKERLEREQKRRADREVARAKQKQLEEERRKKFQEDREQREKEAAEAAKRLEEEKQRKRKEEEAAEAKRLEEQAMRLLLREGERLTEKSGGRSDHDRISDDEIRVRGAREGETTTAVLASGAPAVTLIIDETEIMIESRYDTAVEVHFAADDTTQDRHHVVGIAIEADRDHRHEGATGIEITLPRGEGDRAREVLPTLIDMFRALVLVETGTETVKGRGQGTDPAIETGIGTAIAKGEDLHEIRTETTTVGEVFGIVRDLEVASIPRSNNTNIGVNFLTPCLYFQLFTFVDNVSDH